MRYACDSLHLTEKRLVHGHLFRLLPLLHLLNIFSVWALASLAKSPKPQEFGLHLNTTRTFHIHVLSEVTTSAGLHEIRRGTRASVFRFRIRAVRPSDHVTNEALAAGRQHCLSILDYCP